MYKKRIIIAIILFILSWVSIFLLFYHKEVQTFFSEDYNHNQKEDSNIIKDPLMQNIVNEYIKEGVLSSDFLKKWYEISEEEAKLLLIKYNNEKWNIQWSWINDSVNIINKMEEIVTNKSEIESWESNKIINGFKEWYWIEKSEVYVWYNKWHYLSGLKNGIREEADLFYWVNKGNYINNMKEWTSISKDNDWTITYYQYINDIETWTVKILHPSGKEEIWYLDNYWEKIWRWTVKEKWMTNVIEYKNN